VKGEGSERGFRTAEDLSGRRDSTSPMLKQPDLFATTADGDS